MPLNSGTRLGPYEITSPLGAGGMGEVYRARDTRLGRDVAVKVLPLHLSANAEVRARFEREAKTVSSLNHPNICVLHDVGKDGDTDYLVMELIEGETLAKRLERGALPVADVLRLGSQICDALDRAHRAGIVHRDLKPGNVMLSKSGAKLMDFGLARATGMAGPGEGSGKSAAVLAQSPTMSRQLTAEGSIVGTFQYMSPEQLEGSESDTRSDLWALGCVLYELTTGKRAFEGKSQASLIGAIMNSQPAPISQWVAVSPPALERLVRQCLTRDPDERWQSAGDVRRELEWIAGGLSGSTAAAVTARPRTSPRSLSGWIAAVVILLAALGYAFGPWRDRAAHMPLMRFAVTAPVGTTLATPAEAALSPDGSMIAMLASDSSGTSHLYFRPLASAEARVVPGTGGASLPFWSPDGATLAFFSGGKLRKVALDGSAPVVLCDAPDPRGGAWSKAGVILFAPNNQGPIVRVSASGGSPEPVTKLDATLRERGHRYPQFLPDGKHFLFVAVGSGDEVATYAESIEGGTPQEVCRAGSSARWAPPGYLLFLDGGVNSPHRRLLVRQFDADRLSVIGDAELLLDPVNTSNFGYANVTASDRGALVVQNWSDPRMRLTWRDRSGTVLGTAAEDLAVGSPTLSPDAARLAYAGDDPQDLFVLDLASGVSTRLAFESKAVGNIVWSFDGRTIAFSRLSMSHGWEVYTKAADGAGVDSLLFLAPGLFSFPMSWSRDGLWLVALCADTTGNFDLWRIPMAGGSVPEVYQHTPSRELGAALSPDGHWLAYTAEEEGKRVLYVQSFPNPAAKYQVAVGDPAAAGWSDLGDELLIITLDNTLLSVQVSTAGAFRQGATSRLFQLPAGEFLIDWTRDGQKFLIGSVKDQSSLSRLEIVLGWTQLLEKSK